MSLDQNFRIKFNLSNYFTDHRSTVWILLTKDMKLIRDIEKHINRVFEIKDFYLSCDKCYLPSAENVSIINKNDFIWVLPKSNKKNHENPRANTSTSSSGSGNSTPEHNNKKKKGVVNGNQLNNQEKLKKETPKPVGNNSKLKTDILAQNLRKVQKMLDEDVTPTKNNNNNNKTVKQLIKNQTLTINSTKTMKILPPDKKINIIKSIVIQNPVKNYKNEEIKPKNVTKEATDDDSCEDNVLNNLNLDDQTIKKKRKRVRKRKPKNKKEINTPNFNTIEPVIEKKPSIVASTPLSHIHFDDDVNVENVSEENMEIHETINEDIDNKNSLKEKEINDLLLNEEKTASELTEGNITSEFTEENATELEFTEDYILKRPLITNTKPKFYDKIAFKILRISETYMPEISSFITGNVLAFSEDKEEVKLLVTSGFDQFTEPKGKFFLSINEDENCESNVKSSIDENIKLFKWKELVEPRLLSSLESASTE